MAVITVAIAKALGSSADQIPAEILKSLPQDELLDRASHAADLDRRGRQPGADSNVRYGYQMLSKAMLAAQPRETTERAVAQYCARACRAPDARQAEKLRSAAARLLEQHPIAPRRADVLIAKGLSAGTAAPVTRAALGAGRPPGRSGLQVAVYSDRGRLAGIMNPARIRQRVAKADAGKPAQVAVYNDTGDLVGVADPADIQPLAVAEPAIGNPADMTPAPPADAGTPADDVAKIAKAAADLKRTFYRGSPAEQNQAAEQMQTMAIAGLAAIHGRGSRARPRPPRGR